MVSAVLAAEFRFDPKSFAEIEKISTAIRQTRRDVVNEVRGIETAVNNLSFAISNNLSYALGAVVVGGFTQGLVKAFDTVVSIQSQLGLAVSGSEAVARAQSDVFNLAVNIRQEYQATADLATRLQRSTEQTGRSFEQSLRTAETIGKLSVIGGATSVEARQGLIQFSQGLGGGVLRGDEFRSVNEQLQGLATGLANALGVTRGELTKLAYSGKLSTDILVEALDSLATDADASFEGMTKTIGQSWTQLMTSLLQELEEGMESGFSIPGAIIVTLDSIRENLEGIIATAQILGAVLVGKIFGDNAQQVLQNFAGRLDKIKIGAALQAAGASQKVLSGDAADKNAVLRTYFGPDLSEQELNKKRTLITKAYSEIGAKVKELKKLSGEENFDGLKAVGTIFEESAQKASLSTARIDAQIGALRDSLQNAAIKNRKVLQDSLILPSGLNGEVGKSFAKGTKASDVRDEINREIAALAQLKKARTDAAGVLFSNLSPDIAKSNLQGREAVKTFIDLGLASDVAANKMVVMQAASGKIVSGFDLVRNAGSSLLSFMGGPWGVGFFAATAAIALFDDEIGEMIKSLNPAKLALETAGEALQSAFSIEDVVLKTAALEDFSEQFERYLDLKTKEVNTARQITPSVSGLPASPVASIRNPVADLSSDEVLRNLAKNDVEFKKFTANLKLTALQYQTAALDFLRAAEAARASASASAGAGDTSRYSADIKTINELTQQAKEFNGVSQVFAERFKFELETARKEAESLRTALANLDTKNTPAPEIAKLVGDVKAAESRVNTATKAYENFTKILGELGKLIKNEKFEVPVLFDFKTSLIDVEGLDKEIKNNIRKVKELNLEKSLLGKPAGDIARAKETFKQNQTGAELFNLDEFDLNSSELKDKAAEYAKSAKAVIDASEALATATAKRNSLDKQTKAKNPLDDVIEDLRRKQIELKFAGDSVGREIALIREKIGKTAPPEKVEKIVSEYKLVLEQIEAKETEIEAAEKIENSLTDLKKSLEQNLSGLKLDLKIGLGSAGDQLEKRAEEIQVRKELQNLKVDEKSEKGKTIIDAAIAVDKLRNSLDEQKNALKESREAAKKYEDALQSVRSALQENFTNAFADLASATRKFNAGFKENEAGIKAYRSALDKLKGEDFAQVLGADRIEKIAKAWGELEVFVQGVERRRSAALSLYENNKTPQQAFEFKLDNLASAVQYLSEMVDNAGELERIIGEEISNALDELSSKNPFAKYQDDIIDSIKSAEDLGDVFEQIGRQLIGDVLEALIFDKGALADVLPQFFGNGKNVADLTKSTIEAGKDLAINTTAQSVELQRNLETAKAAAGLVAFNNVLIPASSALGQIVPVTTTAVSGLSAFNVSITNVSAIVSGFTIAVESATVIVNRLNAALTEALLAVKVGKNGENDLAQFLSGLFSGSGGNTGTVPFGQAAGGVVVNIAGDASKKDALYIANAVKAAGEKNNAERARAARGSQLSLLGGRNE